MIESSEKNAQVGEPSGAETGRAWLPRNPRGGAARPVVRLEIPVKQEEPAALSALEADIARAVAAADRASTLPMAPVGSGDKAPEFTVEDLTAFAAQISELVDHARYRVIARSMEVDLARAEAASRRIPPPRLRLAE